MDLFSQPNIKPKYKAFEPFISRGYKRNFYIYYFNWETGTRTKLTTKTRNQSNAIKELHNFKINYYKGTRHEKIKFVSELMSSILHYYKQSHSKKTLEIYTTAFKKFMSVNGDIRLVDVSFHAIEDFKIRVAEVSSKTTANIYLRTLKSAFNYAKSLGYIYENPFTGIKKFILPERDRICFEPVQMQQILENMEKPFLKRIVLFAVYTGARIGEILNLQWGDINESRNIIHIRNKPDFTTKTKKERSVPLTRSLKELIEQNPYEDHPVNIYKQQRLTFEGDNVIELDYKREKNFVFGKPEGSKFSTGYISKSFKACLDELIFDKKYHFHCLRHTACTNMASKGIPAFIIKEIVGHSDIKTTQLYVRPSFTDVTKWLEDMDYDELGIAKT